MIDIDKNKKEIIALLKSTGRENIDKVIEYMEEKGFFESPASELHHNNFKGGLAKHSLEVYCEAVKLNEEKGMPTNSIIICSLLHDICKADQYGINNNKPVKDNKKCNKGHGRRSMFILKRTCQLPLNYDEEMAIWWHMGSHEPHLKKFKDEYESSCSIELCNLIRKADGIAAHKAKISIGSTPTEEKPLDLSKEII